MVYFVYILRSQKDGKRYIGCTNNLEHRLGKHNNGEVRATKHRAPWKLVYAERFNDRKAAFRREKFLKSWAGRIELAKLGNA